MEEGKFGDLLGFFPAQSGPSTKAFPLGAGHFTRIRLETLVGNEIPTGRLPTLV